MCTLHFPLSTVVWPLDWLTWICFQSCSCDTRQQLLEIHSNINNWLWRHFRVNCATCEWLITLCFAFLSAALEANSLTEIDCWSGKYWKKQIKNEQLHSTLCFNQVKYLILLFLRPTLAALVHLAVPLPWHDVLSKQNHFCFHTDIRTEPGNKFHSNCPIRCDT